MIWYFLWIVCQHTIHMNYQVICSLKLKKDDIKVCLLESWLPLLRVKFLSRSMKLYKTIWLYLQHLLFNRSAVVEFLSWDQVVPGLSLPGGIVFCPWARHLTLRANYWFNLGKYPDMTEILSTGILPGSSDESIQEYFWIQDFVDDFP